VLLLTPLLSSAAKENPLFDAYYTSISIKQENQRLDNYAVQLKNSPGSRALIVVYSENEQSTPAAKARPYSRNGAMKLVVSPPIIVATPREAPASTALLRDEPDARKMLDIARPSGSL